MAHDWDNKQNIVYSERVCQRCGAKQELQPNHEWMRVVGYSWEPKAGRCPADKRDKQDK